MDEETERLLTEGSLREREETVNELRSKLAEEENLDTLRAIVELHLRRLRSERHVTILALLITNLVKVVQKNVLTAEEVSDIGIEALNFAEEKRGGVAQCAVFYLLMIVRNEGHIDGHVDRNRFIDLLFDGGRDENDDVCEKAMSTLDMCISGGKFPSDRSEELISVVLEALQRRNPRIRGAATGTLVEFVRRGSQLTMSASDAERVLEITWTLLFEDDTMIPRCNSAMVLSEMFGEYWDGSEDEVQQIAQAMSVERSPAVLGGLSLLASKLLRAGRVPVHLAIALVREVLAILAMEDLGVGSRRAGREGKEGEEGEEEEEEELEEEELAWERERLDVAKGRAAGALYSAFSLGIVAVEQREVALRELRKSTMEGRHLRRGEAVAALAAAARAHAITTEEELDAVVDAVVRRVEEDSGEESVQARAVMAMDALLEAHRPQERHDTHVRSLPTLQPSHLVRLIEAIRTTLDPSNPICTRINGAGASIELAAAISSTTITTTSPTSPLPKTAITSLTESLCDAFPTERLGEGYGEGVGEGGGEEEEDGEPSEDDLILAERVIRALGMKQVLAECGEQVAEFASSVARNTHVHDALREIAVKLLGMALESEPIQENELLRSRVSSSLRRLADGEGDGIGRGVQAQAVLVLAPFEGEDAVRERLGDVLAVLEDTEVRFLVRMSAAELLDTWFQSGVLSTEETRQATEVIARALEDALHLPEAQINSTTETSWERFVSAATGAMFEASNRMRLSRYVQDVMRTTVETAEYAKAAQSNATSVLCSQLERSGLDSQEALQDLSFLLDLVDEGKAPAMVRVTVITTIRIGAENDLLPRALAPRVTRLAATCLQDADQRLRCRASYLLGSLGLARSFSGQEYTKALTLLSATCKDDAEESAKAEAAWGIGAVLGALASAEDNPDPLIPPQLRSEITTALIDGLQSSLDALRLRCALAADSLLEWGWVPTEFLPDLYKHLAITLISTDHPPTSQRAEEALVAAPDSILRAGLRSLFPLFQLEDHGHGEESGGGGGGEGEGEVYGREVGVMKEHVIETLCTSTLPKGIAVALTQSFPAPIPFDDVIELLEGAVRVLGVSFGSWQVLVLELCRWVQVSPPLLPPLAARLQALLTSALPLISNIHTQVACHQLLLHSPTSSAGATTHTSLAPSSTTQSTTPSSSSTDPSTSPPRQLLEEGALEERVTPSIVVEGLEGERVDEMEGVVTWETAETEEQWVDVATRLPHECSLPGLLRACKQYASLRARLTWLLLSEHAATLSHNVHYAVWLVRGGMDEEDRMLASRSLRQATRRACGREEGDRMERISAMRLQCMAVEQSWPRSAFQVSPSHSLDRLVSTGQVEQAAMAMEAAQSLASPATSSVWALVCVALFSSSLPLARACEARDRALAYLRERFASEDEHAAAAFLLISLCNSHPASINDVVPATLDTILSEDDCSCVLSMLCESVNLALSLSSLPIPSSITPTQLDAATNLFLTPCIPTIKPFLLKSVIQLLIAALSNPPSTLTIPPSTQTTLTILSTSLTHIPTPLSTSFASSLALHLPPHSPHHASLLTACPDPTSTTHSSLPSSSPTSPSTDPSPTSPTLPSSASVLSLTIPSLSPSPFHLQTSTPPTSLSFNHFRIATYSPSQSCLDVLFVSDDLHASPASRILRSVTLPVFASLSSTSTPSLPTSLAPSTPPTLPPPLQSLLPMDAPTSSQPLLLHITNHPATTLRSLLSTTTPLSPPVALKLLHSITNAALTLLHKGWVHRCISLDTILVIHNRVGGEGGSGEGEGEEGACEYSFVLGEVEHCMDHSATLSDSLHLPTHRVIHGYTTTSPPEHLPSLRVLDSTYNPSALVFSIAVATYTALQGTSPWEGMPDTTPATAYSLETTPKPSSAGIPPHVATTIQQALQFDPTRRPSLETLASLSIESE